MERGPGECPFAFHEADCGVKMNLSGYGVDGMEGDFSSQAVAEGGVVAIADQGHAAEM